MNCTIPNELISLYGYREVGIFTALLMNLCTVAPGQAVFVAAKVPHACLSGDLFECIANSQNVVRAGLPRKFQDVETFFETIFYELVVEQEFCGGRCLNDAGSVEWVGSPRSVITP